MEATIEIILKKYYVKSKKSNIWSSYEKLEKAKLESDKSTSAVAQGQGDRERVTSKWHRGIFGVTGMFFILILLQLIELYI